MARPFFDTNVLLYLLSADVAKAVQAETLLAEGGTISVQVLNEFASVASRKAKLGWSEIRDVLSMVRAACQVVPLTAEIHEAAITIAERLGFALYDSLIVAAAAAAGCEILYSEDLQNGQLIDSLIVANPFAKTAEA